MKAVVIQHETHEDVGRLGPALNEAGFTIVRRFRGVEHADVEAALVVVLGGPMGVYEAGQHPFLREEQALLAERLAMDRPCVGICLGAQLLAAAAGADVFPGKNGFEVGVGTVRLTKEAAKDPVFGPLKEKLTVAHWHGDTFTPVPGGVLLASSDRYTQQAFRVGRSYGLQFHAELDAEELGQWMATASEELKERGKDVAALRAQLPKLKAAEGELWELLVRLAYAVSEQGGVRPQGR